MACRPRSAARQVPPAGFVASSRSIVTMDLQRWALPRRPLPAGHALHRDVNSSFQFRSITGRDNHTRRICNRRSPQTTALVVSPTPRHALPRDLLLGNHSHRKQKFGRRATKATKKSFARRGRIVYPTITGCICGRVTKRLGVAAFAR